MYIGGNVAQSARVWTHSKQKKSDELSPGGLLELLYKFRGLCGEVTGKEFPYVAPPEHRHIRIKYPWRVTRFELATCVSSLY